MMSVSKWINKNTVSLCGKTVAISGSTGGLGRELCVHLAALGASLILLDRNMAKSHALADELRARFPELSVSHIKVDMESINEVKEAAATLKEQTVDYLILNAGAYSIPRHRCESGFDNVFQINFVSPYYLARALLRDIRARGGRVVAVGSIAHGYSKTDPDDVDFSTRKKASLVYGNAKRYLMFSLLSLDGVTIAHPGITFTGITSHYPRLIFALIKHPMKLIFMKPRKACLSVIRGLFEDCGENEWIGPAIFGIWGYPKKQKLRRLSGDETEYVCRTAQRIYEEI